MTVLPATVQQYSRATPVISDLYVAHAGYFPRARAHYVARPEGLREMVLIYCVSGAGWCEMLGTEWQVTEGCALFVTPDTPHVYGADPDDPWTIWWVRLSGQRLPAYLLLLGVSAVQPLMWVPDVHGVTEAFEEMYARANEGYSDATLLRMSTSLSALLSLLKWRQRSPGTHTRGTEEKIYRSIEFMREHLGEPLRLGELARAVGMSVPYYSTQFKRMNNTSPIRYFIHLKMKRACELLDGSSQSVAEIAPQVGYSDPFHFSRIFKQVVGKSPRQYRETTKG